MQITDKYFKQETYKILSFLNQRLLPGLGTLYFGLSTIWGFPYGKEIVGTIAVINTFLGSMLGVSTHNYKKIEKQILNEMGDSKYGN
jgi:hypothetical protein